MRATTQTACSRVESVKPSIVYGRVDGLAIPWWQQRQPKPTWKISRYSLACTGSASKRSGNWAYGFISKPMRFEIQQPAARPTQSLTRSWKRQTCTNTCRSFENRFQTMPCQICTKCYITSCTRKHMRKGEQASNRMQPPAHAQPIHELALMTYWICMHYSSKNVHDTQAEWLNGACAAYSSNKTSGKPRVQKVIHKLSIEVCGKMNKVPGASSSMKGIWKTCGYLCSPPAWQHMIASVVCLQQLLDRHLQGCPSGPYMAATVALVHLRVWLQSLSTVLRARLTTACQVSQVQEHNLKSTVRMLWHASVMPSAATSHKPPRSRDNAASSKLQTGALIENGVEGKSTTPGLPGVHRPLPFTLHSMPAHHLEPHHRMTPQPTLSPIPAPIALSKDTRHRPGPPKPAHHCRPSGDEKHRGEPRNKVSTVHPPLRKRLTLNIACLIAWINCSCTQSLTWDSAIARCHGLSSAPRVHLQHQRVAAESDLHSSTPDQDCKCVAAMQSQHVVILTCWEPHGPRAGGALPTGVSQILFTSTLQHMCPNTSHSTDPLRIHLDLKSASPKLSLRCAVQVRARMSRPALPQGALAVLQVVLSAQHVMLVGLAVNASIMQGTLRPSMCAQKARCPSLVKSLSPEKGSRRRGHSSSPGHDFALMAGATEQLGS